MQMSTPSWFQEEWIVDSPPDWSSSYPSLASDSCSPILERNFPRHFGEFKEALPLRNSHSTRSHFGVKYALSLLRCA